MRYGDIFLAWSRRFIPKLFVWHSLGDIVRMKWRYYRAGLYTEKKRSHWLKQWPKIPDNFTNPSSVNIFLTTPNVPYITIRTNSLSSLALALHFISPPWKRLSSNLWILFSANKKNSFTPWRSPKPLELSIGWPFQRFDEVQITSTTNDNFAFSYLLNSFLLATALTNEISSFLYINQLGSISISFWRYPLKSIRRKASGWISYFTPSSSSVPPNVLIFFSYFFCVVVIFSLLISYFKNTLQLFFGLHTAPTVVKRNATF